MTSPCTGHSPFHVKTMLAICETCPTETKAACLQSAADAPFQFIEAQVWGGLVLPAQQEELPQPTRQKTYPIARTHERTARNKNGSGRPPWWHHIGRNLDPDLV